MGRTEIWDADGETTVAIPVRPELISRMSPEGIVRAVMPAVVRSCREIGGRPIAGRLPEVLSEREMRQVDPGAILWKPGMVWLAFPVVRDRGESVTEVRDLSPE